MLKEKTINYLVVEPGVTEEYWGEKLNGRVRDESRALGFFLGQHLKEHKVKGLGFDGLFYEGFLEKNEGAIEIVNRLLCIPIQMLDTDYPKEKDPQAVYEYLISHIHKGNKKITDEYPNIVQKIEEGIEIFRANNYEYTWVHKKKRITGVGVAKLVGYINIEKFILTLQIEYKNGKVISSEILETPPNEYSFKHRFKGILIEDAKVKITDHNNDVWYEFSY